MYFKHYNKGFTLLELLITIGILAIILSGGIVSLSYFLENGTLDSHAQSLAQTLRRTQMQSIARYKDSTWGVYFDVAGNRYILFKGDSYESRTTSFDEVSTLPGSLSFSNVTLAGGGNTITFSRGEGRVIPTGSLTIRDATGHTMTITINAYGTIEIQ